MIHPIKLEELNLDHLTAKYEETAAQVTNLQDMVIAFRDRAGELEQSISEKQLLMKNIIQQIIKKFPKSDLLPDK